MTRLAMKKIVVIAWGLAVPFAAVAQTQRLSLKQGMYVQLTYECVGAPNAAVMFWDGCGVLGRAHEQMHVGAAEQGWAAVPGEHDMRCAGGRDAGFDGARGSVYADAAVERPV